MTINKAAAKLLAAIKAEHDKTVEVVPPGWFTMDALAKESGVSSRTLARALKPLISRGEWEMKKLRIKTNGGVYPVPHYRETK